MPPGTPYRLKSMFHTSAIHASELRTLAAAASART